ncbi:hypothetical protein BD309DRAFT_190426 [Dichomitus squalens]|uniref:Uncharacterized protein n=1 Tax=Dichomitus squalens TaxID=114155 RepID=A0A4Q9Q7S3_9APHY|nr:hypothetical protein BD309DRAFT_190426 [Dichomitus squalens]TBU63066.1 hypothetical protein BD310DRAFT_666457 [Dichomitus squalens]
MHSINLDSCPLESQDLGIRQSWRDLEALCRSPRRLIILSSSAALVAYTFAIWKLYLARLHDASSEQQTREGSSAATITQVLSPLVMRRSMLALGVSTWVGLSLFGGVFDSL